VTVAWGCAARAITHAARRAGVAAALVALVGTGAPSCARQQTPAARLVVLGFDGLDYGLTGDLMARGRLPHFSRLAERGTFAPLGSSIPPQSPVAWSTFITGLDPGGHGIFDFVHRDPATLEPYLSTTRTEPARRRVRFGRWQLPLSGGSVELLRKGQPFWDVLERRGIPTTIIRMPANFPPSGSATRELSGMGTPDVLGSYGTFSFYTSEPFAFRGRTVSGGAVHRVEVTGGAVRAWIEGPENPFLVAGERVRAPFTAYLDSEAQHIKLVVGGEERLIAAGEWSDWVPVAFTIAPTRTLQAQCRFYLRGLDPYFELYVSPPNIDPMAPVLPISTPSGYAADLARAAGRYYTQGMAEDTNALASGVLSAHEFLVQARITADENHAQYRHVLDTFTGGLLFYYFGHVDQVSHMMWRPMDPAHPAYTPDEDRAFERVVEEVYEGLDAIVGETLARLGPDDLLVVMSDHGFTSWRRTFHLNSWLREEGYLTVRDPYRREDPGYFSNVDWSRTRAYALGLNGLYVNQKDRESRGIVERRDRDALLTDIVTRLLAVIDPATGEAAVTSVHRREEIYTVGEEDRTAPDLVVGYARGTRGSDESALGGLTADIIVDNTQAWNGDHCMDHEAVPGVLLTSRALRTPARTLQSLAGALLAEFGIEDFPAGR
jgi:predicted AlkP superfamily phosphohydrolase/phosphomutase